MRLLDDLGVNLKPARDMGMTTIKVVNAPQAIAELEAATGLVLRWFRRLRRTNHQALLSPDIPGHLNPVLSDGPRRTQGNSRS